MFKSPFSPFKVTYHRVKSFKPNDQVKSVKEKDFSIFRRTYFQFLNERLTYIIITFSPPVILQLYIDI